MSDEDAEMLGVAKDRKTRSAYVRLDDAKQNYAAIGDARWFEKVVYALDSGEFVPAAVPWKPPDMWDRISTSVANRILDDIEAGIEGGRRYSNAPKSTTEQRGRSLSRTSRREAKSRPVKSSRHG